MTSTTPSARTGGVAEHPFSVSVAVVTGASRGIGRAIATELASRGACVAAPARNGTELDAVVTEITEQGGRGLPVRCDVAVDGDVERLVEETRRAFGPASILVNSAGIYRVASFLDAGMDDFRRVMEVNYFATVAPSGPSYPPWCPRGTDASSTSPPPPGSSDPAVLTTIHNSAMLSPQGQKDQPPESPPNPGRPNSEGFRACRGLVVDGLGDQFDSTLHICDL